MKKQPPFLLTMSRTYNYNLFLKKLEEKNKKWELPSPSPLSSPSAHSSVEMNDIIQRVESDFQRFHHDSPLFNGKLAQDDLFFEPRPKKEKHGLVDAKHDKPAKRSVVIEKEIQRISDLLDLIQEYPLDETVEYNINMTMLHQIKEPLTQLHEMIGLQEIKTNVVNQLLYFMQNLHKNEPHQSQGDFMHCVIYGPPGTGKTEVAKILGQLYSKLGILKKNVFKKVTRSDLVASYLGQTAAKTRDVINECLGGVLFIDEAYALGNREKKDSFSKECIDTLCEALSDHKDNLMVIIAGYEKELKQCFFNYNPGLDSRFQWRFHTEKYNAQELFEMFQSKVKKIGWQLEPHAEMNVSWFEKRKECFAFYGRHMEVLLSKVKICHGKRVFCRPADEKKKITLQDLENGFAMFSENEDVKKRNKKKERKQASQYLSSTLYI